MIPSYVQTTTGLYPWACVSVLRRWWEERESSVSQLRAVPLPEDPLAEESAREAQHAAGGSVLPERLCCLLTIACAVEHTPQLEVEPGRWEPALQLATRAALEAEAAGAQAHELRRQARRMASGRVATVAAGQARIAAADAEARAREAHRAAEWVQSTTEYGDGLLRLQWDLYRRAQDDRTLAAWMVEAISEDAGGLEAWLRYHRASRGLTLRDVSRQLEVPPGTIANWLSHPGAVRHSRMRPAQQRRLTRLLAAGG